LQADSCIQVALHVTVAKADPVFEYTRPVLVTQAERVSQEMMTGI